MRTSKTIKIGQRLVGADHPPYIVAEMSGNHNQSLARALEIVDAAAACGVDALKLQTYTADTMTLNISDREFTIQDPKSLWANKKLHQLYQEAHTPWEWHKAIFDRCASHGIACFSTPFDPSAVDFLESLNAPAYKIASFENTDVNLIKRVAATGKPVIISTGMASLAELEESVRMAREAGCNDLILLKCTSTYPASPANTNLRTIPHLREMFSVPVGLSDHTMGIGASVASVALGAIFIEKHFTIRRSDGGVDSDFSMEPTEMRALVEESKRAWEGLGEVHYGPTSAERPSLQFRRSLYVAEDMRAGEIFSDRNLRSVRPGLGLPPKFLHVFLGKAVNKSVPKGTPLSWDLIG